MIDHLSPDVDTDGLFVVRHEPPYLAARFGPGHDGDIWSWRHAACGHDHSRGGVYAYAHKPEAQRRLDEHVAGCDATRRMAGAA